MSTLSPLIVALDYPEITPALAMAKKLNSKQCRVKVGKELFTSSGPAVIESLKALGFEIFLDLKFHDIPNTVNRAVKIAAQLGVWMISVHTLGGQAMLERCREALFQLNLRTSSCPLLIGVTILTHLTDQDANDIGLQIPIEKHVQHLALLAQRCHLDGVVCSPWEARKLRALCKKEFVLVTPGIRHMSASKKSDDQARIATPLQALNNGSNYIVIGRPITQAPDPMHALQSIMDDLRTFPPPAQTDTPTHK